MGLNNIWYEPYVSLVKGLYYLEQPSAEDWKSSDKTQLYHIWLQFARFFQNILQTETFFK